MKYLLPLIALAISSPALASQQLSRLDCGGLIREANASTKIINSERERLFQQKRTQLSNDVTEYHLDRLSRALTLLVNAGCQGIAGAVSTLEDPSKNSAARCQDAIDRGNRADYAKYCR